MDHLPVTGLPSSHSMYLSIQLANDLKIAYERDNNFKYDCVIRLRNDFELRPNFPTNILNELNYIHVREFGSGGINDQFALSTSENMDLYSQCFDYIEKNNIETTAHEEILTNYFDYCGLREKTKFLQEPWFFWM
jgi:hypothetical protein